ncbi:hypothetical protein L6R52_02370 [Myxococcota bacterium]|nr:hypothetical protein [Myxococcota bacterium]
MSDQAETAAAPGGAQAPLSEYYSKANRLNAKLASSTDANLIREGRQLAQELFAMVKAKVTDFDDFVRRVKISEEYSLTESRQLPKTERDLKVIYLRAASLEEAAAEAEQRAARRRA